MKEKLIVNLIMKKSAYFFLRYDNLCLFQQCARLPGSLMDASEWRSVRTLANLTSSQSFRRKLLILYNNQ